MKPIYSFTNKYSSKEKTFIISASLNDNESFTLIDHAFVTEHLPKKFVRMEIYNDHVFRHHDLSSPTKQEQQWKSKASDHGIVVVEFKRMLK